MSVMVKQRIRAAELVLERVQWLQAYRTEPDRPEDTPDRVSRASQ